MLTPPVSIPPREKSVLIFCSCVLLIVYTRSSTSCGTPTNVEICRLALGRSGSTETLEEVFGITLGYRRSSHGVRLEISSRRCLCDDGARQAVDFDQHCQLNSSTFFCNILLLRHFCIALDPRTTERSGSQVIFHKFPLASSGSSTRETGRCVDSDRTVPVGRKLLKPCSSLMNLSTVR